MEIAVINIDWYINCNGYAVDFQCLFYKIYYFIRIIIVS